MAVRVIKRITNETTTSSSTGTTAYSLANAKAYSVQSNISTSGAGSVKLQATNVPETDRVEGDWQDIADSSQTISGDAKHVWNVTEAEYEFVRLYFTVDSGTFTTTNYITIKDQS